MPILNRDPFAPGGVMDAPDLQARIAANRRAAGLPLTDKQERRLAVRQGLETQNGAPAGAPPPGISQMVNGDVNSYRGSMWGAPGSYTAARPAPGISSLIERSADTALRSQFGPPPNERQTTAMRLPDPAAVRSAFSGGTSIPQAESTTYEGGLDIADARGSRFVPNLTPMAAVARPGPTGAIPEGFELPETAPGISSLVSPSPTPSQSSPDPRSLDATFASAPVTSAVADERKRYDAEAPSRTLRDNLNLSHLENLRQQSDRAWREQKAIDAATKAYLSNSDPVAAYLEGGGGDASLIQSLTRQKDFSASETVLPSGTRMIKNTPQSFIPDPLQPHPTRTPESELGKLIRERADYARQGDAAAIAAYDNAISNYRIAPADRPLSAQEYFGGDAYRNYRDQFSRERQEKGPAKPGAPATAPATLPPPKDNAPGIYRDPKTNVRKRWTGSKWEDL